jgi:bifunctional N-acetylglucosamine-1-phosphate-uridyltransferase/glucosamine-1-phosphate-acetyltransferase GlmU-like protein
VDENSSNDNIRYRCHPESRNFEIHPEASFCMVGPMLQCSDLFDFPESLPFGDVFSPDLAPWEWLPRIRECLADFTFPEQDLEIPVGLHIKGPVYFGQEVQLPAYGSITGPAYIGAGCTLRPGVYIRGNVIAGARCVLGNSCEFKNALLLDEVQVPHFSYVGDSILGNQAHLGAGATCSNLRLDQADVRVQLPDGSRTDTGLRKLGAILGDQAEVGCNAVLNPGSIVARKALITPGVSFRGYLKENSMAFSGSTLRVLPRVES